MFCCTNCFSDKEVKAYIEVNSTQRGNCQICKATDTNIILAAELFFFFEDVILAYTISPNNEIPEEYLKPLYQHLKDWNIFADIGDDLIESLVKNIGSPLYLEQPQLFDYAVVPQIMCDSNLANIAAQYATVWDSF